MLLSLHVKNLALIEEEEVAFTDGLNILTGETGAGKSIIIGSVNLALGGKTDKSIIRTGADYALIEMIFQTDNDRQSGKLREMELPVEEDGTLLIKRKIMPGRSVCSVNGETVTLRQLRDIAGLLIDVYGQRENQKLLRREAQLQTVDEYAGEADAGLRAQVRQSWQTWKKLQDALDENGMDEAARKREMDLLSYEINEISEAALSEGEDEALEKQYRLLGNFRRISEAASGAAALTDGEESSASDLISRACRELASVSGVDEGLDQMLDQLSEIDSLLSDFNRGLTDYVNGLTFDPEEFQSIQDRLNLINHLKDKYGRSIPQIQTAMEERMRRLDFLQDYEGNRQKTAAQAVEEKKKLLQLCAELSSLRHRAAEEFAGKMREALLELNFNQVEFEARFVSGEELLSGNGYDRMAFYISMNPGEAPRPLEQIASGGELSRIMLGMKTVFAGRDDIHTFVFDEIDTGISGQTAWKVAEKMGRLARNHQILCITHLPQIAAMEDSHYLIAKESAGGRTATHISRLSEEESDRELGRMLGTATVTEATLDNAREMKRQARAEKAD